MGNCYILALKIFAALTKILFVLLVGETVKAGLWAQAPIGNGGIRVYENLTIENITVNNIRMGK